MIYFVIVLSVIITLIGMILSIKGNIETQPMKDINNTRNILNIIGRILNVIVSVIYLPFSYYSYVGGIVLMAYLYENEMSFLQEVFVNLLGLSCTLIPLLCFWSVMMSLRYRKKGKIVISFAIQFLPLLAALIWTLLAALIWRLNNLF